MDRKKIKHIFLSTGAILFVLSFIISSLSGCSSGTVRYNAVAQCITEKGAVMYGTEWCSHCKSQKKMFGSSFKHINYTDCDVNKKECELAGVEGYPTWVVKGKLYSGAQSIEKLSLLTECKI